MYHALVTSMMLARFSVVIAACMVSTASADSAATDHPGSTSTLLQLEEVSKRRGEQEGQDHGEEFLEDIDSPVFKKVERTETSRRSGLSRDRGRAHGTTLQLLLQQNDKKIDHELTILGLGWIAYVSLVCALGCLGGCCHGFSCPTSRRSCPRCLHTCLLFADAREAMLGQLPAQENSSRGGQLEEEKREEIL